MPLSGVVPAASSPLRYGINMLIYGDPGIGKTPMIADGEHTLILDADHGSESAVHSKADIKQIDGWGDMEDAYEYLRHEKHPYKWVWFDGISIGQDPLLEDIMADVVAVKDHRKLYAPDKGEYGQNMNRMKQWIRHMRALPVNFGITAHPIRLWDSMDEVEKIMPWIQGRGMINYVCGQMNVIGYFVVEADGSKILRVRENDEFIAKDRFVALGSGLKNPSIPTIQRLIEAKAGGAQKPQPSGSARKVSAVKKAAGPRPVARKG